MEKFIIYRQKVLHDGRWQDVLKFNVHAFYHADYVVEEGETEVKHIIWTLKNQWGYKTNADLAPVAHAWRGVVLQDLPAIYQRIQKQLVVCVVPRAKAQNVYTSSQMRFREEIKAALCFLASDDFVDGTQYIIRRKDTKTTHLERSGYGGEGSMPYPGITKDTCEISAEVRGKDILLIDDLYTPGVYIDEDAIQALYDKGAASVVFYSLGKTRHTGDGTSRSFSIDEFKAKMGVKTIDICRDAQNGNLFFAWGNGCTGEIASTALTEDRTGCIARKNLEIIEMYADEYVTMVNPTGVYYLLKARNM